MSQAERYLELTGLARGKMLDASYQAAFYLLSCQMDLFEVGKKHVSINGIHFAGMKRTNGIHTLDDRDKQIIDIAHNLFSWSSKCKASPFDISRLGYPYMEMVCNAIFIAAGECEVVIERDEENNPKMILDASPYQRTGRIHREMNKLYAQMVANHSEEIELER